MTISSSSVRANSKILVNDTSIKVGVFFDFYVGVDLRVAISFLSRGDELKLIVPLIVLGASEVMGFDDEFSVLSLKYL